MTRTRTLAFMATALLVAAAAQASWYDDYDAGVTAARKGQWSTVVAKMNAAISGNAKENNAARTYGNIFINYHPYYYRGLGNLNLGKYQAAIDDFEKTQGPGEYDAGSIGDLIGRAKFKLEQQSTPEPAPAPTPAPVPRPQPPPPPPPPSPTPAPVPIPQTPQMDPILRSRAIAAVNAAKQHLTAAQKRRATGTPPYNQAMQLITDANTRAITAKTNDDLNAAIALADNATLVADSAQATSVAPTPVPQPTRPYAAADAALSDTKRRLREALDSYFRGDFDEAAGKFETLARRDLPNNGWVWAFLGASQYSRYAFELDPTYKTSAMDAFKRAKQLGTFKKGLPDKYFSKRIRKVFETAPG